MTSSLFEALGEEQFCVTAVRGLDEADVLERLGHSGKEPLPRYGAKDGVEHLGLDSGAVRIYCPEGAEWAYVFDVNGHSGFGHRTPVLERLSAGTEAVSVWSLIASTTHVAHIQDGQVLARFNAWTFEPASGPGADRLNRALERMGFFLPDDEVDDELSDPAAALEAVEDEFGLLVDPEAVAGPLPTVVIAEPLT
ncbi:DUF6461 domain-containing protein [Streptomyces sp. PU-14G]|uniref:DUF6461 domain-containing protein n=1 Tax=Streptomyces sp. PU-14G TaxID=2800808 RepID=UPI0034DFB7DA